MHGLKFHVMQSDTIKMHNLGKLLNFDIELDGWSLVYCVSHANRADKYCTILACFNAYQSILSIDTIQCWNLYVLAKH